MAGLIGRVWGVAGLIGRVWGVAGLIGRVWGVAGLIGRVWGVAGLIGRVWGTDNQTYPILSYRLSERSNAVRTSFADLVPWTANR